MNKTCIAFLLGCLCYMDIKGQVHDPNFTPFAWGASIGGFVCFADPHQPHQSQINKDATAGFSFGGVASFRKRKYYFETGLNMASEGYTYTSAVTVNNVTNNQKNTYKFYSVMLPLRIVIPVQSLYCRHLPSLALNLAYGVKEIQLQTTSYENAPYTKNVYNVKSDYNKLTPSFTIAYGVEFDLDANNALRFEPTLQFTFLNAKSAENKTTINNIGLRAYFLFLR